MSDEVRTLREQIGHRFGMTTALAQLLVGETEADIEADVRAFLQAVGADEERVVTDPVRVSAALRGLLQSKNDAVQLGAVRTALAETRAFHEAHALAERVSDLEARLEELR